MVDPGGPYLAFTVYHTSLLTMRLQAATFRMLDTAFGNFIRSSNGADAISIHTPWTLAPSLLIGITFSFRRFACPHDVTIVDQDTGRLTSDHCALHQVAHFDRELQALHTWNVSNTLRAQSLSSWPPSAQAESIPPSPQSTLHAEVTGSFHSPDIKLSEQ